jgi:hypothetical protein
MGKMIVGSLDLTAILEKAKAGHSSIQKGKNNGKLYVSLVVWQNDEVDQYGNHFTVQLSSSKEMREKEGKAVYVGNLKYLEKGTPEETVPVQAADITTAMQNLPF